MRQPEIILEGGPMAGYRVPRADGEIPPRYPCDWHARPTAKPIDYTVQEGARVFTARYVPSGRVKVEFCHDTPIYAYVAA